MIDKLEIQSGLAKRILNTLPYLRTPEAIAQELDKTEVRRNMLETSELTDTITKIKVKLMQVKDIRGTANRVTESQILDDIELFELKAFSLLVVEILEYLKENEVPVALASSTRKAAVMEHLNRAGITGYFQKIVCGDMVDHGKPAPDIYVKACEEMGVKPEQAMAVEDSFNGIRSAHAAGLFTVMVPDQLPPTEEILTIVDKKCDSLTELQTQLPELLAVCGD